MASAAGTKSAADAAYALDSRTASFSEASTIAAHSRDSFSDDEELQDLISGRSRRGFFDRFLAALGMSNLRSRKRSSDYHSPPGDGLPDGLLRSKRGRSRPSPPRELRNCRRSCVAGFIKRSLLALPILILIAFGILHVTEAFIGGARLLWDPEILEPEFLAQWSQPGHAGEGLVEYPTDATRDVVPIPCHSHNDYWRRVPLFDAIHWGCTGVEADVWLFDEELYVGHNTAALTANRTFRNLYINPLVNLLDKMNPETEFGKTTGHGVFDEDPSQSLTLLVDFKTGGHDTFPYVHAQLDALRQKDYLTYWDGQALQQRAITVVGTGNTPFDLVVQNSTRRDIFFDAPLDRMYEDPSSPSPSSTPPTDFSPANSYYASVSLTHTLGFIWNGATLSSHQLQLLRGQIKGAHRRGLKVRYWDTPSWPVWKRNQVWRVLMREGADVLNVDDLKGAAVENWRARGRGGWV